MTQEENAKLRLQELEALDERRLEAQQRTEIYQARMSAAFNRKVKQRVFRKGDLVLAVKRPMIVTHKSRGKFDEKWEGPFIIAKILKPGTYKLDNSQGEDYNNAWNIRQLRRFYP